MTTQSMWIMNVYTTRQLKVEDLDNPNILQFLKSGAETVCAAYERKFDWHKFGIVAYIINHRFVVCFRNEVPVGFMLSRFFPSIFDPTVKILFQDSLFQVPGSRAVKYLMQEFIDFGNSNADHVISVIGKETNIKRQSLEKLGFKELETLYRMEIKA